MVGPPTSLNIWHLHFFERVDGPVHNGLEFYHETLATLTEFSKKYFVNCKFEISPHAQSAILQSRSKCTGQSHPFSQLYGNMKLELTLGIILDRRELNGDVISMTTLLYLETTFGL